MIEESIPYNFYLSNNSNAPRVASILNANIQINEGSSPKDMVSFDNNMSYFSFLNYIVSNPFSVSKFYVQLLSNITSLSQIIVIQRDTTGRKKVDIIKPVFDPMQNQDNIYEIDVDIAVDGYTAVSMTLPAFSSLNFSMYPSTIINPANDLIGKEIVSEYKMPSISQFLGFNR